MTVRLLPSIAGVLVLAACGTGGGAPPTAEPSVAPQRPPAACLGLDAADCAVVVDAVVAALGQDASLVTYLQVGPFGCGEAPCPRTLGARPQGEVVVELAGRDPVALAAEASGASVKLTRRPDAFLLAVTPASARLSGTTGPFQLGHCGLFSGIDIDGSFWDPVGAVDADHADAINSADAVFTMTSPRTATLRTRGGLSIDLIRHQGPKYLPGCM